MFLNLACLKYKCISLNCNFSPSPLTYHFLFLTFSLSIYPSLFFIYLSQNVTLFQVLRYFWTYSSMFYQNIMFNCSYWLTLERIFIIVVKYMILFWHTSLQSKYNKVCILLYKVSLPLASRPGNFKGMK